MTEKKIHVLDVGRMPYAEALDLQKRLVAAKKSGDERDFLILVEHPGVVTVGRRGNESHIRLPREALAARGVEVYDIERGGDVTYHGPGQVVGYPIIDLKHAGLDVHSYLRLIETAVIEALRAFHVESYTREGLTGVWTRLGKVAAIGIAVSRWITYHGFAVNVLRGITGFDLIVPCGLTTERVTSIEDVCGSPVEMKDARRELTAAFARALGAEAVAAQGDLIWKEAPL
ncbi:MAG: lipoyl(octanoyl) transferase LipB [Planctomycetes bacterium]|nr:lipoyl(octanoyl) transferase LipB [Planctomycetota bacterium]